MRPTSKWLVERGEIECSRSWARQSSGAFLYRTPKSGDSGYEFKSVEDLLQAVYETNQ